MGTSRAKIIGVAVFSYFLVAYSFCCAESGPEFYEEKNVVVPMRDGVKLSANIFRPSQEGKFPTLIFRTPYSKDEGDPDNEKTFKHAVKRGYAVVVQDVRGRFKSEGEFSPYRNEGKDGYDTIEWAASQPWSDGHVGTFGLSYPGAVQWYAALENPPHLKAIVPAMVGSTPDQFIYFSGVFEIDWTNWCYRHMSPDARAKKNLPGPKTYEEADKEYNRIGMDAINGYLPTLDMPYLKGACPYYYDWLRHGPYTAYWDWGNLEHRYGKVKAAVLNISGWYDESYGPQGATKNFMGLVAARKGWPDPKTQLLIGSWTHGVESTRKAVSGERKFGAAAIIDYDKVVLDFLDHYVRGIENGVDKQKPVKAFLMAEDRWLEEDAWPLKGTVETPIYLSRESAAAAKGDLTWAQTNGAALSSFVSDPANPVKDNFGTTFGAYNLDYLAARPDVLTFETEPFSGPLNVAGNIRAEIYVSTEAPDCDLYVKMLDVAPEGTAFNLMSPGMEVMRVSYRDETPERKLIKKGEVIKLVFKNLRTGNTFKQGHRLRVQIMGSWYPTYSRNLQTGESETVSSEIRKAGINIHHSSQYPSRLILPVIPLKSKN
ncbi:MAG: CocE/NonD family hydrolase [Candidatus Omnitrophota bacterium]